MNKTSSISIIAIVLAVIAIAFSALAPRTAPTSFGGGVGAASFGEASASSTLVSVLATSTKIVQADAHRSSLIICNESANPVTIAFNTGLATSTGIVLNPQASSTNICKNWEYPSIPVGAVYGVSTATSSVGVLVGDGQ